MSNLIVFPVNLLIMVLFRKARARKKRPSRVQAALKESEERHKQKTIELAQSQSAQNEPLQNESLQNESAGNDFTTRDDATIHSRYDLDAAGQNYDGYIEIYHVCLSRCDLHVNV